MADGEQGNSDAFLSMVEGTADQWANIAKHSAEFGRGLPGRIISHLKLLDNDFGGFAVDRLEHSLQTATRAFKDGRDEEYVVCALLHDIGDILGPRNHADIGAAILQPFVSEQNHWMVEKHAIFQGYCFEYTAQFCHLYDQSAFDPKYESMPLEAFEPMLQRVMATPKNSIYLRKDNTPIGS